MSGISRFANTAGTLAAERLDVTSSAI